MVCEIEEATDQFVSITHQDDQDFWDAQSRGSDAWSSPCRQCSLQLQDDTAETSGRQAAFKVDLLKRVMFLLRCDSMISRGPSCKWMLPRVRPRADTHSELWLTDPSLAIDRLALFYSHVMSDD